MRILCLSLAALMAVNQTAWAFCGFYVATSDQSLTNKASRVVLAHKGNSTLVTMASDVGGDPRDFAIVIPVPTVIRKEQVNLVRSATVEHLAEFSKPRLVQYFDPDPCPQPDELRKLAFPMAAAPAPMPMMSKSVKIEAQYSVGEYDIVVLSATDSTGLVTYLNQNHYRIPPGAEPTIGSYIRQNMHFFLAKVNMARMQRSASGLLRPIQVEYASPKFMLPIRLGTVNATGPQDMIVLALTERGRVETTNYQTVKMVSDQDIPLFVQNQFGEFYDATFERQVQKHGGAGVFLEYAWNIGAIMCDPCSASSMTGDELRELGAKWVTVSGNPYQPSGPAFITRMHVRYDREHFPEDLQLQETADQEPFQVRFVTHQPFVSTRPDGLSCPDGRGYRASVAARAKKEATTLADLTGWLPGVIANRMATSAEAMP